MSDGPLRQTSEGVLRRWSRRKQAAQAAPPIVPEAATDVSVALEQTPLEPNLPAPNLPAPDLPAPDLPAIESLGGASDYTAFLQKGVTAEVQRLALQRAWQSDASIADFRGMAEYAWDFNAPQYGDLWASDDVAKLLQAVLTPPEEPPAAVTELGAEPEALDPTEPSQVGNATTEPLPSLATEPEPAPQEAGIRRHGSALPS